MPIEPQAREAQQGQYVSSLLSPEVSRVLAINKARLMRTTRTAVGIRRQDLTQMERNCLGNQTCCHGPPMRRLPPRSPQRLPRARCYVAPSRTRQWLRSRPRPPPSQAVLSLTCAPRREASTAAHSTISPPTRDLRQASLILGLHTHFGLALTNDKQLQLA